MMSSVDCGQATLKMPRFADCQRRAGGSRPIAECSDAYNPSGYMDSSAAARGFDRRDPAKDAEFGGELGRKMTEPQGLSRSGRGVEIRHSVSQDWVKRHNCGVEAVAIVRVVTSRDSRKWNDCCVAHPAGRTPAIHNACR